MGGDGAERDVRGRHGRWFDGLQPVHGFVHGRLGTPSRSAIASTRMACPPPADSVERDYVAALEQVRAWRVENGELMLVDADETEVLRYQAATPVRLLAGDWVPAEDAIKNLIAGTEITHPSMSGHALRLGRLQHLPGDVHDRPRRNRDHPARSDGDGVRLARRDHGAGGGVSRRASAAVRYRVGGRSLELLSAEGTIVVSYMRVPAAVAPAWRRPSTRAAPCALCPRCCALARRGAVRGG